MVQERLSKLQKWILSKCLERILLSRGDIREFFGKEYPPSKKDKELSPWEVGETGENLLEERQEERRKFDLASYRYTNETYTCKYFVVKERYIATKAEEVTISRTLKNLQYKGLLDKTIKYGDYYLNEKGFLIVNSSPMRWRTVNNCAPCDTIVSFKEYQEEVSKLLNERKIRFQSFVDSFKPPVLSDPMATRLISIIASIQNLCCDGCREKIEHLKRDTGLGETESGG